MRVLVTRAEHQADRFTAGLQTLGIEVVHLPTMAIEFYQSINNGEIESTLSSDIVIFTSTNAVTGALRLFPRHAFTAGRSFGIASIGTATTEALQHHSINVEIAPPLSGGSEQLLEILDPPKLTGSKVTIVRGDSGRDKLLQQLQNSGVVARYQPVYRRYCPPTDPVEVRNLLKKQCPDAISITSNDGLLNLLKIAPVDTHRQLFATALLVNSDRCATLARKLGFQSQVLIAKPPGDTTQLELAESLLRIR
ncbi:hypothetical protein AB833_16405 [Chromatiales bacterium (ex Bugula neritina AB1)]|nr:hypothetical protein AB833_16405 [Chromatiales bacterium (ex Bugula neritina AB1)]